MHGLEFKSNAQACFAHRRRELLRRGVASLVPLRPVSTLGKEDLPGRLQLTGVRVQLPLLRAP